MLNNWQGPNYASVNELKVIINLDIKKTASLNQCNEKCTKYLKPELLNSFYII